MIDWAIAENDRPCSKYYHKLDTQKVAANGSSCGTWMTLGAAQHPNMATIILWNGGLFSSDPVYDTIHTPVMFFVGGKTDIASPYADNNFTWISGGKNPPPLFWGSEERPEWTTTLDGHIYDFFLDNGGEAGIVAVAWFKWQLFGDQSAGAKGMFWGTDCGLCKNPPATGSDGTWTIKKANGIP